MIEKKKHLLKPQDEYRSGKEQSEPAKRPSDVANIDDISMTRKD